MNDQPLIAYRARVEAMVARFERACADGGTYYERVCLAGWRRELARLREGRVY